MNTTSIKEELHEYVDLGDRKLLHMMKAMAKAYFEQDYTLPGEPMTHEEFIERIRQARTNVAAGKYTTQEDLENEMGQW